MDSSWASGIISSISLFLIGLLLTLYNGLPVAFGHLYRCHGLLYSQRGLPYQSLHIPLTQHQGPLPLLQPQFQPSLQSSILVSCSVYDVFIRGYIQPIPQPPLEPGSPSLEKPAHSSPRSFLEYCSRFISSKTSLSISLRFSCDRPRSSHASRRRSQVKRSHLIILPPEVPCCSPLSCLFQCKMAGPDMIYT